MSHYRILPHISAMLIFGIVFSACGGKSQTTTVPPAEPSPTQSRITTIVIDGNPSDWDGYPVVLEDAIGDSTGNVDIKSVRVFTNDKFFYLLVETANNIGSYVQLDVDFNPFEGWPDYMANAYPNNQDFTPHLVRIENKEFIQVENRTGEVAQGTAFEMRLPLDLFNGSPINTIGIRVMDGECCESKWIAVDFTEPVQIAHVDETDGSPSTIVQEVEETPAAQTNFTQITIDGKADDWADRPVNILDPVGDQVGSDNADLIEAKYFMNDQFLYGMIKLENPEQFESVAVLLYYGNDQILQLTLRKNNHVTLGFGEEHHDIIINMANSDIIEFKSPLTLINKPGPLQNIHGIEVYENNLVDKCYGENCSIKPLLTSNEIEGSPQQGQTNTISGVLHQDTIWSGEVHITGDIILDKDVTLTIEPGTTVYLTPNQDDTQRGQSKSDSYIDSNKDPVGTAEWDQNAITIDGRGGTILAVGTAENPIIFRPEGDSTSSAQWDGIYIERGSIQHSKILYAGRTAIQLVGKIDGSPKEQIEIAYNEIRNFHWAGIDMKTYNAWIHHNTLEGGGHQALVVGSQTIVENNYISYCQNAMFVAAVDSIIRNNIVEDCARGIQVYLEHGQIPAGTEIPILNNTIVQQVGPPDGWYYQDKLIYPSFTDGPAIGIHVPNLKLNIQNNIIVGPFSYGIALYATPGSGSIVGYNLIWETDEYFFGNITDTQNIFSDPMLADDFSLKAGSPAIDAGSPDTVDSDGSPADLGAFGGQ